MAQIRYHDFYAEATTQDLNEHFDQVQRKAKISGLQVTPSGTWQVVIGPGVWFCDGVAIKETTAVSPALNISAPSSQPRWDIVYGQYTYQPTSPPPVATYGVKQGTPGNPPTIPALEENQVALAYIYIPPDAASLEDCDIYQALCLKDQVGMILEKKYEGNIFIRSGDPKEMGEWVRDGDLWLDTDTNTLLTWDEPSQRWVPPTVPPHAPTHQRNGSDVLDVATLADANNYLHPSTKAYHDSLHLDHAQLSNVLPDQHHARDHAMRHMPDGGDPLPWGHGGGTNADMVDGYHASAFAPVNHTHDYNYAPKPHGNECHEPDFAEVGHLHPLSDITGTISIGWIQVASLKTYPTPSGTGFFETYIPNINIEGTVVEITDFIVRIFATTDQNLTFALKKNGSQIGAVTIPAKQTMAQITFSPRVSLATGDILSLDGPSSVGTAKGLDAKIRIIRRKA